MASDVYLRERVREISKRSTPLLHDLYNSLTLRCPFLCNSAASVALPFGPGVNAIIGAEVGGSLVLSGLNGGLAILDLNEGIIDYLSSLADRIPLWKASWPLALAAVFIWLLTRLDKDARRHVELRRHLWESTSTYESEFRKVKSRGLLGFLIFIGFFLVGAMVIVSAHVLVP